MKKKIYRNEDDNKDNNNTKKDEDDNKIKENNNDPDADNYLRIPNKEENSGQIKIYSRIKNKKNKDVGPMNRMIHSVSSNIIKNEKMTIKTNEKTKKSEESSTEKISNVDIISKIDNNKNEKKDDKKNEKTSTEDGGSNHNNELISETDKNTTSKEQKQLVQLMKTMDNKNNNLKESKNSSVYIPNPNSDKLDIYGYDDKLSNNQDNKDDSKKDNSNKDDSKKDDFIYKNDVPKEINEEQPSNQKKKEKEKEKENTIESSIRRKDPYDQQSDREKLKKPKINDQEDEVKKNDFNELFKNLVYLYKRNTQTPKDVDEFKKRTKDF